MDFEKDTEKLNAVVEMMKANDIEKFQDEGIQFIMAHYNKYKDLGVLEFLYGVAEDVGTVEFTTVMGEFYIGKKFHFKSDLTEKIIQNVLTNAFETGKYNRRYIMNIMTHFTELDFFKHDLIDTIVMSEDPYIVKQMLRSPNFNWNNIGPYLGSSTKSLLYILCTDPKYDISLIEKLIRYSDGNINEPNKTTDIEDGNYYLNPLAGALKVNTLKARNLEVAELLLSDPRIDVNKSLKVKNDNRSVPILSVLLELGADYKSIELLVQRKNIEINKVDNNGHPPLFYCGSVKQLVLLKNYGANLFHVWNGENLLRYNIRLGDLGVIKYLIERNWFDINAYANNETHFIFGSYSIRVMNALLKAPGIDIFKKDIKGNNALHVVCSNETTDAVQIEFLLNLGFKFDEPNDDGHTPLICRLINVGFDDICKLLITKGADVNYDFGYKGNLYTPFTWVLTAKDVSATAYMIYFNANFIRLDRRDLSGNVRLDHNIFGYLGGVERLRSRLTKTLNPRVRNILTGMENNEEFCTALIDELNEEFKENEEWIHLDKMYKYLNDPINKETNIPDDFEYNPKQEDLEREYRELSGQYYHPEEYSHQYMYALIKVLAPYTRGSRNESAFEILYLLYNSEKNFNIYGKLLYLSENKLSSYLTESELIQLIRLNLYEGSDKNKLIEEFKDSL